MFGMKDFGSHREDATPRAATDAGPITGTAADATDGAATSVAAT